MRHKAVIFKESDNVATAIADLATGDNIQLKIGDSHFTVKIVEPIPFGHKFSVTSIESDSPVIKYGEVIGLATMKISPGSYVHVHNVVSARGRGDLSGGKI